MVTLAEKNPAYFRTLDRALDRIDAGEFRRMYQAARSIWYDQWDLNRIFDELERVIYPDPPPRVQVIEHDPEKAAQYFRERGAKVITA